MKSTEIFDINGVEVCEGHKVKLYDRRIEGGEPDGTVYEGVVVYDNGLTMFYVLVQPGNHHMSVCLFEPETVEGMHIPISSSLEVIG